MFWSPAVLAFVLSDDEVMAYHTVILQCNCGFLQLLQEQHLLLKCFKISSDQCAMYTFVHFAKFKRMCAIVWVNNARKLQSLENNRITGTGIAQLGD